jgi:hypothetical protein
MKVGTLGLVPIRPPETAGASCSSADVAQSPATGNGFVTGRFDNSFDVVRGGLNYRF